MFLTAVHTLFLSGVIVVMWCVRFVVFMKKILFSRLIYILTKIIYLYPIDDDAMLLWLHLGFRDYMVWLMLKGQEISLTFATMAPVRHQ